MNSKSLEAKKHVKPLSAHNPPPRTNRLVRTASQNANTASACRVEKMHKPFRSHHSPVSGFPFRA